MNCITHCWNNQTKTYSCSQCQHTPRPAFGNMMFDEVTEELEMFHFQSALPAHCNTRPEDVECDMCTLSKNKAVKSCLECLKSYCQNHLEEHNISYKFNQHNLTGPTRRLKEGICPKHGKHLEIYCHTDGQCICHLCTVEEHMNHKYETVKAKRTKKQSFQSLSVAPESTSSHKISVRSFSPFDDDFCKEAIEDISKRGLSSESIRLSSPQFEKNSLPQRHGGISRSLFNTMGQGAIHLYRMSIIQKYDGEKRFNFQFKNQMSSFSLHREPMIIEKRGHGKFQQIRMNELIVSELFNPKTVILQGSSGSGKSFIAQKIMLDWASKKHYLTFDLVFCLRCEELMCISKEMNLIELLSWNCNLTSDQISQMLQDVPNKVLIIIDGFDELRLTKDIFDTSTHTDPLQRAPPEVIVCGLVRRYILPESTLLVNTRTKDTLHKLLKGQQHLTQIMGFSEREVELYFQNIFGERYNLVKSNEALYTACSIPVICWILSERFKVDVYITKSLKTTTSIYFDNVSTLLEHHCQSLNESVPTLLRSLGQLAERGMMEQQVLFDEKTVNETVSDPASNLFLLKKTIQQKTMFSFKHFSFQEFFTALYYVLLNDDQSQKKVRELLHTVERGWALSSWSVTDFSVADLEIRSSNHLQSVILYLCGLCKSESIISFFEKHNVAVSINIETQLKEWIHQCSQRYQHEIMLFILHCLYELHDKSFTGKVLEGLILIDLSNISLNRTDCWVLRFCLQCCEHIRNLRLNVTSDHLTILQSALYSCEELWLMVDDISDCIVGWISTFEKGKILNKQIVRVIERETLLAITVSVQGNDITCCVTSHSKLHALRTEYIFICTRSDLSNINWKNVQAWHTFSNAFLLYNMDVSDLLTHLRYIPGLKKVHLQVLTPTVVTRFLHGLLRCPTMISEISIQLQHPLQLVKVEYLKESYRRIGWTLTNWGNSVLMKQNQTRFTEELRGMYESRLAKMLDCGSFSTLEAKTSSRQLTSEDADVFIPEIVRSDDAGKQNQTYRFVSTNAGQFQCSLTNIVFVMEDRGEMLYKIKSWDPRLLDGLGQMQPAGPLYSIDCFEGSISQLHLPHCEILSEENKDSLAVAHFTDGNVEILDPLRVTSTHVIINITELSLFGLIKWIISPDPPVRAQVLLFLRAITVAQNQKILNVHLLPGNVPLSEVQSRHQEKTYIETSSLCHLISGREYRLCCQPEECEVQPSDETFECNFGPNFHPTFEVFLDVSTEEVRLGLLDASVEGKEVWKQRRIPLSAKSQAAEPSVDRKRTAESEFVDNHRDILIQRVTSVMEIADSLLSKNMITNEMYKRVHTAGPQPEKMRIIFDVLESGGTSVKAQFYRLLKEKEPHLVDEWESGPSKT